MTLLDTNLWLALVLSKHSHHQAARRWLESQSAPKSIVFCRATQQSLLRLLSTAAVLNPYGNDPLTNQDAWSVYDAFMADHRIAFCSEPKGVEAFWKKLAARQTASPKLWMDAYLAAFAMAAGCELLTIDSAFSQFPGLKAQILASDPG